MHRGADAADALGDGPGVARIAAHEDLLQAAHHGAGAECVGDDAVLHHCLDAQVAFNASDGIDDDTRCHNCLRLLLIFSVHFRDHAALADVGDHGMGRDSGQRGHADRGADGVGRALDAEAGERRQVLVERAVVPEARLAAADAAVARLDGIAGAFVPLASPSRRCRSPARGSPSCTGNSPCARSRRPTTPRTARRRSWAGGSRCRARGARRTPWAGPGRRAPEPVPAPAGASPRPSSRRRWAGSPGTLMTGLSTSL